MTIEALLERIAVSLERIASPSPTQEVVGCESPPPPGLPLAKEKEVKLRKVSASSKEPVQTTSAAPPTPAAGEFDLPELDELEDPEYSREDVRNALKRLQDVAGADQAMSVFRKHSGVKVFKDLTDESKYGAIIKAAEAEIAKASK